MERWTDNVKTVYPPHHKHSLRGGIKNLHFFFQLSIVIFNYMCSFVHHVIELFKFWCPFGFPLVLLLFQAVLIVCFPFPFGVWGRMWNLIVSVPDHCLFIYML